MQSDFPIDTSMPFSNPMATIMSLSFPKPQEHTETLPWTSMLISQRTQSIWTLGTTWSQQCMLNSEQLTTLYSFSQVTPHGESSSAKVLDQRRILILMRRCITSSEKVLSTGATFADKSSSLWDWRMSFQSWMITTLTCSHSFLILRSARTILFRTHLLCLEIEEKVIFRLFLWTMSTCILILMRLTIC